MLDATAADRAVKFIELFCTHTKDKWAGVPFILEPWQRDDIIRPLFGTLREDGTRQYRRAFIEIPRKNGKSELAAAVALKLLFADDVRGGEIYGAATDIFQASIVFNVAAQMVRNNPVLSKRAKIIDSSKRIVDTKTDSVYRAIPADAAGSHGFNASGIVFDELHAQPNRELWDVLTTSTGARSQPLVFAITTAGHDRNSVCYEQHDHALKILRGVIEDPSFFAYIRSAPDDADWTDEKVWASVNPALGVFRSLDEMREFAREAQQVPARENVFRNLYLNQWTASETRWLPLIAWDASAGILSPNLDGRVCYGGLYLTTNDLAAFVLVFPPDSPDGSYQVVSHFWIPEENLHDRVIRDGVPYDSWARDGLITVTEGNIVHYAVVRAAIEALSKRYNLQEIGYNKLGPVQMTQELDAAGITVTPIGYSYKDLSPPTKELLNLVLDRRLRHGGNAVLRFMADALTIQQDTDGNVRPVQDKTGRNVSGIKALIMALDRAIHGQESISVYETRPVMVL